jgi:hypothetical protein
MFLRSVAIATLITASASIAVADDPGKAPCELMAEYFRDYARYHPKIIDTGGFEFLSRAAHIGWDRDFVPARNTRVSAINARSFDRRAAAVQAIHGVTDEGNAQQLMEDVGLVDSMTELRDLRPYSKHVILSQNQGTMHCDYGMFFRIEGSSLVLSSNGSGEGGAVCWTQGLTAIRVGRNAYPAIQTVDSGPSDLGYTIALLNPDGGSVDAESGFCRVNLTFQPNLQIDSWYPDKNVDAAFLAKVRAALEPMLLHDSTDAWDAHVKALRPKPTGNDLYDILLRAEGESNLEDLLHSMDPPSQMARIPNADNASYTLWGGSTDFIPDPYLIEIDRHRLLLFTGQPTLGWRTYPDLAFAVWEWNGTKVVPVVSGYLAKRATNPKITVDGSSVE